MDLTVSTQTWFTKKEQDIEKIKFTVTGIQELKLHKTDEFDVLGNIPTLIIEELKKARIRSDNKDLFKSHNIPFFEMKTGKRYSCENDIFNDVNDLFEYKVIGRRLMYKKRRNGKWKHAKNSKWFGSKFKEIVK